MFKKILIANRGEIACRIIRTCKRMGIGTVAVYSDADKNALHALSADERVAIGPAEAKLSYLDIEKIIAAAKRTGAEAIHPGYGFLAENPAFARALNAAGITLIGPTAEVIELMGDKLKAKELATSVGVPIIPGFTIEGASATPQDADLKKLKVLLNKIGYPILIKAAAGGGGRGMRKIYAAEELSDGIASAAREAMAFFKDDRLFIEKLVENARHIEVQFFGDSHGNAFHLFDRDCSMQRRHQKVIEEAPAPLIHHTVREKIRQAALAIAKASKYTNAGTAEFLLDSKGNFYFLEINTRLQVEHPVTEMVTGLDLVELQLLAASGEDLQDFVTRSGLTTGHGVAIEARICAEVPEENFTAASGTFSLIEFKSTTHLNSGLKYNVRVDTGYATGDTVSHYYDSLIAKVVVHAENRTDAIEGLRDVLRHSSVFGVKSNVGFLLRLTRNQKFIGADHHIALAETLVPDQQEQSRVDGIVTALGLIARLLRTTEVGHSPWKERMCWRHGGQGKINASFLTNGRPVSIVMIPLSPTELEIYPVSSAIEGEPVHITHMRIDSDGVLRYRRKGREEDLRYLKTALDTIWIQSRWGCFEVRDAWPQLKHRSDETDAHSGEIHAPFPGKIVSIKAQAGSTVEIGEPILVIESMKMEHLLKAPLTGELTQLFVASGDVVEAHRLLAKIG